METSLKKKNCDCAGSSLLLHGLSLIVASGGYSSLLCAGFSLWWLLLLQSTGSKCTGFSHSGAQTCGMWNLPRPGIEPMSFALAGKFFTTEPFLISLKASFVMFVCF